MHIAIAVAVSLAASYIGGTVVGTATKVIRRRIKRLDAVRLFNSSER